MRDRMIRISIYLTVTAALIALIPTVRNIIHGTPPPALAQEGDSDMQGPRVPELPQEFAWLNTDKPLSLREDLKGHVVLLDFWTYCCINCLHVLDDLKYLEEKYADDPFLVIGVHSAKFENESDPDSIRNAMLRHDVEHPVVVDEDMRIWRSYGVRAWPTLVLIGPDGRVIGAVSGEGNRETLDVAIAKSLKENKDILAANPVKINPSRSVRAAGGLSFPGKVLADIDGKRLFIADTAHHRIVEATLPDADGKSEFVRVFGTGNAGYNDGASDAALFADPQGLALNGETLYVADTGNHSLRAIDLTSGAVTTVAGNGKQSRDRRGGGVGTEQGLNSPWDLALKDGVLYIAMAGPHQLWAHDIDSGITKVFAGSGREDIIDGPLMSAALAQPSGLAIDGDRLYFADSEVSALRYVDLEKMRVETIVGEGLFDFGDIDGPVKRARFQHPLGVDTFGGNIYVADTFNHKIKMIDTSKNTAVSFIGLGEPAAGDAPDGPVGLAEPGGLHIAGDRLFIADTNNHRVVVQDLPQGQWHEVMIAGLDRPARRMAPLGEGKPVSSGRFAKEQAIQLRFNPDLPERYKLTPEAPLSVRISDKDDNTLFQKTVYAEALPLELNISPDKAAALQQPAIRISLHLSICETGNASVCRPDEFHWDVTFDLDQEAVDVLELK